MPALQDAPPAVVNGQPAPNTPGELAGNLPREPSPDGNVFARTSGGAQAGGPRTRTTPRYNLRSRNPVFKANSNRQNDNNAADGSGHVADRSRAHTMSRRRDDETRDSSVGKRNRDGDDDPEGAELRRTESRTAKRPRTVSTTGPRGRSLLKKTEKKR